MKLTNNLYEEYLSFRESIGCIVGGVSVSYRELHDLRDEADSLIADINKAEYCEAREILVGQMLSIVGILTDAIQHRNIKKAFD
jgi:hypothetical protein